MFVGHVGYPQTRAPKLTVCGHCGSLVWEIPTMPTTERKAGSKETGVWGFVGNVGNLPIRFKLLAYNIRVNTIYKIQFLAIYPFIITHNTHKQAGSGSQAYSRLPTTLPTIYPTTTHKTTRTPKPYQCSQNPLRLTDYWSKIRRAVEV
jgi:hypothetical protein